MADDHGIPSAALICIGSELTEGHIRDRNGHDFARLLTRMGFAVSSILTIPDSLNMAAMIASAASQVDLLLITGGLGPTSDDMTREAVAQAAGVGLLFRSELWEFIQNLYGKKISDTNRSQAEIPEGFEVLHNPVGSAAGFYGVVSGAMVMVFPGPPSEIAAMRGQAVRVLEERFSASDPEFVTGTVRMVSESRLESLLQQWVEPLNRRSAQPLYWGTRTAEGRVILYLRGGDRAGRAEFFDVISRQLGPLLFEEGEIPPAERLSALLHERGLTLCGAESCTGGLISAQITSVPGISSRFTGTVVSYANEVKQGVLGLDESLIARNGAVSSEAVSAMLSGAREHLGADCAYAVSGIAGPGGGSEDKPVGTVFIGVDLHGRQKIRRFQFRGNRERVRLKSTAAAMLMLEKLISLPSALDREANWEYSYH